jgi:ketosteroid isomerase-like protein
MSEDTVNVVRAYYEALARLGRPGTQELDRAALEQATAAWHEDGEWLPQAAGLVEGASFHGHEELRQYFTMLAEVMESVEIALDQIRPTPHGAVAVGRLRAKGRGSGAEIEEDHGVVYEIRDGLITRARSYRDRERALEVAGLSE